MLGWFKTYFKLAIKLHTPFVILMDKNYTNADFSEFKISIPIGWKYEKEYRDCDKYAWVYRSQAIEQRINNVGFVVGLMSLFRMHSWNIIYHNGKVRHVEPQTLNEVKSSWSKYIPFLVII